MTSTNMDTNEVKVASDSTENSAPLPWTKPTLERLSLKQALKAAGAVDSSFVQS